MPDSLPPERPTSDLTRHTLSSLQWSYLGTAVGGVLQFGMAAVMARLLTPAAFGLVALAALFLRFVDYFAKAGISQALIQKATLTSGDIRAAFALSTGLSGSFGLLVLLAAPLAGRFAQDADLVPVLRWLVLGLVFQGVGAPSIALLRRRLRFKSLAMIDVGSYVVGYVVVGLSMAVSGAGVFALVAAILTQGAMNAGSAYALVRHPLLPTRARQSYRAILSFGARISIVGFFEFLQSNLDTLALGRWAGATQLGLYNRAKLVGELPAYQLTNGLSQVLFPSFSAIQADRLRLKKAYLSALGASSAIILPLNAGMAVAANEIVTVVLGPQWLGAIPVLPWLLLASSLALLGHFASVVAQAQAALNAKILISFGTTVTLAVLLMFAEGRSLSFYGAAVAAAAGVSHIGYVYLLTRTLRTTMRALLRPYISSGCGTAIVAAAIAAVRWALNEAGAPSSVVLLGAVVTGAVVLPLLLRAGPLKVFRDDFAQRLFDSGIIGSGNSRLVSLLAWLVGPVPDASDHADTRPN
jgi:lipopolysaccharide exporter